VRPAEPLVTAGPAMTGRASTNIVLDAGLSYSWNAKIVEFQWSQLSGTPAQIVGPMTAAPTIVLPDIATESEVLRFEVIGTDENGRQGTSTTDVTVLGANTPWTEFTVTFLDPVTGLVEEHVAFDANNSYIDLSNTISEGLYAYGEGRYDDARLTFDITNPDVPRDELLMYWRNNPDPRPDLSSGISSRGCSNDSPGWLHVKDIQEESGQITSVSFESEHYCHDRLVARVSARFNSVTPIRDGEAVVIQTEDKVVEEGTSIILDDVAAYVEGEFAADFRWQQLAGPAVRLATSDNARTSLVAPPITADADVMLRLSVTTSDGQVVSEDLRISVQENGIDGFPDDLITLRSVAGSYEGTGDPVAFETDHLVYVSPESPTVNNDGDRVDRAPYGVFDLEFDTDIGETISFTIHFPQPIAADAQWYWKVAGYQWRKSEEAVSIAPDLMSMTIEVSDRGPSDWDSSRNGRISVRGGVVEPSPYVTPNPGPQPSGGGGGGGGVANPMLLFLLLTAMFRRTSWQIDRKA
ncbi:MAG: choice-of-anchor U domain-containing protein, partial [Woeseiaceae bacterium]